jgi:hypothetical protein
MFNQMKKKKETLLGLPVLRKEPEGICLTPYLRKDKNDPPKKTTRY